MKKAIPAALIISVLTLSQSSYGEDPPSRGRSSPRAGPTVDWSKVEDRIAWYGTLKLGRAAAKRTRRPILLVAGAPHCGGVPGVW